VLPVLIDFAYFRAHGNKIAVKAGLVYFKEDRIRKGIELLLNLLEPFPILLSVYTVWRLTIGMQRTESITMD
jgi:hypothetical protein